MDDVRPLVLDVDGTFLKTDLLFESFWAGLGQAPGATILAILRHGANPAALKADLAQIATLRTDLMPVNPDIAEIAMQAVEDGREVVFASASHEGLVADLARDYGLSDRIIASTAETNMKGETKARALVDAFGAQRFDYAGDASADRAIWTQANAAIVIGQDSLAQELARADKPVQSFPGGWRRRDLIRALRPHQWVKNVLLLVPMLAAHEFTLASLVQVMIGIIGFSAAASAVYIVNDLLDLEADRQHPKKRNRPFASGAVPIRIGMGTAISLAVLALGAGLLLGGPFFAAVVLYMALSLAYSLRLKRLRWVDIATLAGLYSLRVIAGGAAIGAYASGYLMVFIYPVFLTLGCVKRLTEVVLADTEGRVPGRGYGKSDQSDLYNVAWLGVVFAMLAFFLYSFSEQARLLYPSRWLLWVALVPIYLWLRRMVQHGYQGRQDYDPVVFAMTDKRGVGLILITLSIMFFAAGLWQEWFGF